MTISDVSRLEIRKHVPQTETPKGRKKQHSTILPATPVKASLEETARKMRLAVAAKESRAAKKVNNAPNKKQKKEKKVIKNRFKSCRRNITFESSTEEEMDSENLCDDDECDDLDVENNREICLVCGETKNKPEIYHCIICRVWAHALCSGWDSPNGYKCDFCN